MKRVITLAVFLLILSPASAWSKSGPDWIGGASKKYPEPRYFIGVGSTPLDKGGKGQQMEWAGDSARAEIAKTIRTEVKVTTRSERAIGSASGAKSTQTDVVTSTAREVLEGVEIKEYHRDKKGRMLYALAVLDRYGAAKNLEKRAQRIKQDIASEVDAAGEARERGRALSVISHYGRALAMAGEITEIEDLLGILKPGGAYSLMEAPYHESTLREAIRRLRKEVRFSVSVEGPGAKVRGYLINGLSKAGYVTGTAGGKAYDLKGTTELTYKGTIDMGQDMLMQIYQADLDLEITDPASGEVVGTMTWSASANEKSEVMAERSAVRALGEYVQRTIADKMGNIL
ncbi:MAG: LPP20 family lipoprotein [Proteobacteria bacterium]|nr:LPP20 family lipoprotein [Pseudomonadota bacterium]